MIRYAVRHATVYEYGGDVAHSHHLLHLKPRDFEYQRCLGHSLLLDPEPTSAREDVDAFGNPIARLEYDRPHDRLSVTAAMRVEILPRDPCALESSEPWEEVRRRLCYHPVAMAPAELEACRFRMQSSHVRIRRACEDYARDCFTPDRPIAAASEALMRKIHREIEYVPGSTTNRTSISEVLESRRGVCQDFAHLMIGCLRSSGLAARYVSGYVRSLRAKHGARSEGGAACGSAGPEAAAGGTAPGSEASHAWVSVYCPPLGWVDFDPTNDCLVRDDHVTLAWGRDFGDVSPLRGMIVGGGQHRLSVEVRVRALESGSGNTVGQRGEDTVGSLSE
jgi:transglutaminase-like putative cysteine protease